MTFKAEMSELRSEEPKHDYSTGAPRRHHCLYIEDGNFVLQVENAIFKVHRYFLTRYSSVLRDMLDAPRSGQFNDGTDEKPLVLTGDSASSWELLLAAIYDSHFLEEKVAPNGESMLSILSIAHKYCMEKTEKLILDQLKQASTTEAYVDLLVGSAIVDSQPLHQTATQGLISCSPKPTLKQAKRIGMDAYYTVMATTLASAYVATNRANENVNSLNLRLLASREALGTIKVELVAAKLETEAAELKIAGFSNTKCTFCDVVPNWSCSDCGRAQAPQTWTRARRK